MPDAMILSIIRKCFFSLILLPFRKIPYIFLMSIIHCFFLSDFLADDN